MVLRINGVKMRRNDVLVIEMQILRTTYYYRVLGLWWDLFWDWLEVIELRFLPIPERRKGSISTLVTLNLYSNENEAWMTSSSYSSPTKVWIRNEVFTILWISQAGSENLLLNFILNWIGRSLPTTWLHTILEVHRLAYKEKGFEIHSFMSDKTHYLN
jgi:hypothetical protein